MEVRVLPHWGKTRRDAQGKTQGSWRERGGQWFQPSVQASPLKFKHSRKGLVWWGVGCQWGQRDFHTRQSPTFNRTPRDDATTEQWLMEFLGFGGLRPQHGGMGGCLFFYNTEKITQSYRDPKINTEG